jgi:hypothetical protein
LANNGDASGGRDAQLTARTIPRRRREPRYCGPQAAPNFRLRGGAAAVFVVPRLSQRPIEPKARQPTSRYRSRASMGDLPRDAKSSASLQSLGDCHGAFIESP